MELQNITLEDWLKNPPSSCLKRGGDNFKFSEKYEVLKEYLANNLHKEVTKQAIFSDFLKGKDKDKVVYLNDHGQDHVQRVILMATNLLCGECELSAKEVFFLLNAIQIHDIGNFYGRIGHENNVRDAIREGLTPILFDRTEVNYIANIAQVHGGMVKYKKGRLDKNTIASIKPTIESDDYTIRQQLLASVLRFSDELADYKKRADTVTLENGTMPKGSEIFHAYAACLDSVKIDHEKQTVELHFKVPKKYLLRTFGKIQKDDSIKDEYLVDEIYNRAIKMHTERIYCSKFWKKFISIEKIWVEIEFYADMKYEDVLKEDELNVHPDITFTLDDNEYPNITHDIFTLCPNLTYQTGDKMDGINILKKINNNGKSI